MKPIAETFPSSDGSSAAEERLNRPLPLSGANGSSVRKREEEPREPKVVAPITPGEVLLGTGERPAASAAAAMRPDAIPFNQSTLLGRELEHIFHTMTIGQIAGDQTFSRKCHELLEEVLGVKKALLTASCTHALEMCALLLDIQPGDEVIVPSFTFVSTANAFALRGARIVFGDIRPDTLNLDETRLEGLITSRTRAVVAMHYAGVGCEMDAIGAIAARHGLAVVEDDAHGLFGKYRGRWRGTFGCLATRRHLEWTNYRQERLMRRAEDLTDPAKDPVYDGVGLVPARSSIHFRWLLHSMNIRSFTSGPGPRIHDLLAARPAAVFIPSYRNEFVEASGVLAGTDAVISRHDRIRAVREQRGAVRRSQKAPEQSRACPGTKGGFRRKLTLGEGRRKSQGRRARGGMMDEGWGMMGERRRELGAPVST